MIGCGEQLIHIIVILPSLTSGNQWQNELAKRTPPPKFNKNENTIFRRAFLLCLGSEADNNGNFLEIKTGKYPKITLNDITNTPHNILVPNGSIIVSFTAIELLNSFLVKPNNCCQTHRQIRLTGPAIWVCAHLGYLNNKE